jgi:hypothetical protein
MEEQNILKSRKTAPDTRSWYEHIWREKQETPKRLEDAAKFLASMISISLSIFLAIGKTAFENSRGSFLIKLSLILWLLSLIVSFSVLFPWRYKYVSESVKSIKEMNQRVARDKYALLILSLVLFLSALSILAYLFLI